MLGNESVFNVRPKICRPIHRGLRYVVLLVALVTAACNSATDPISTSASTSPVSTSIPQAVTTSVPPATTTTNLPVTTTPPATTTSLDAADLTTLSTSIQSSWEEVVLGIPEPLPGSKGASGSGCSPGTSDLPDGVWFGFVVSRDDLRIEFDLACWFSGDIAHEKAAEAGDIAYGDYWIVNENPRLRSITVNEEAIVWAITGDATEGYEALLFGDMTGRELTYNSCPGENCAFWLYLTDGVVVEMVDQYRP